MGAAKDLWMREQEMAREAFDATGAQVTPIVSAQQYAHDRANEGIPSWRGVPRDVAEQRSLFLVKEADNLGLGLRTPTTVLVLEQLARSSNAAVANEARRLMAQP